jgi:pyroglutamyl-peptidase
MAAHQTLLLTGFEPFGGETINPSWEVARAMAGEVIGAYRVESVCLPCVFALAPQALQSAWERLQPDAVICLGQAEGRAEVTPERVAINCIDARIPDNANAQPRECPVVPGGPTAYFSGLPLAQLVARLQAKDIPTSISNTAGTFVCNQVFYELQHRWGQPGRPSGFVHLPCLPEQAARMSMTPACPSLPLGVQILAVREIVAEI